MVVCFFALVIVNYYSAFLCFTEITLFDEKGNKTSVPNKERQIETLQLVFMLLPPANRSLLKLLLDLLYQTAKHQDKNKMSAFNLALMFAPHIIWPKNVSPEFSCTDYPIIVGCSLLRNFLCTQVTANDLQDNLNKLNNGIAFLIKHSQKLFRVRAGKPN